MSIWNRFATIHDYPKGMMNLCPCGQVVLAPATYHEGFPWWDNPNKCKEMSEASDRLTK